MEAGRCVFPLQGVSFPDLWISPGANIFCPAVWLKNVSNNEKKGQSCLISGTLQMCD